MAGEGRLVRSQQAPVPKPIDQYRDRSFCYPDIVCSDELNSKSTMMKFSALHAMRHTTPLLRPPYCLTNLTVQH